MRKWLAVLWVSTGVVSASTISGASDYIGNTFTVAGGITGQKSQDLVGVTGYATFGNGTFSCTFVIDANSDATCTSLGNFSILVTPPTAQTTSADWVITNLRASGTGSEMLTLTMSGFSGNTVFNPDVAAGHPTANTTCGNTITDQKSFGNCRSAGDTPGGTTSAQASVLYLNAAHLSAAAPNLDLWESIVLTYNTSLFTGGQTFQFKIDTDGVATMSMDAPEPGTFGLGGLALLAIAGARRRRRKQS